MTSSTIIPLLLSHGASDPVVWRQARAIDRATFLGHVNRVAETLPRRRFAINLCEDRYYAMVAFAAVIARGQSNLLPPSRSAGDVSRVAALYPDSYRLNDDQIRLWLKAGPADSTVPAIPADQVAAVAFTSGSSGQPRSYPKRWADLVLGARMARRRFGFGTGKAATVVATVPPQHMYGLETSVLVPLVTGTGVHSGRPFFPADIQSALLEVPGPRVLITTPAHLRVCAQAELAWPEVAFIISATAPMPRALALAVERIFAAPLLEIYGFTEAGSVASRRTLDGETWTLYDGFWIQEGCVHGESLPEPVPLNDRIELYDETRFKLVGRPEDLINIAGKRASLADLNQQLNSIEGVEEGVVFMPEETEDKPVRLAALVVAPGLGERQILTALATRVDPVFLPRPLYKVEKLPRNETGKLPREQLLALLTQARNRTGIRS